MLIVPLRQVLSGWLTSFCRQAESVCRFSATDYYFPFIGNTLGKTVYLRYVAF
jgi:hypothetical protein